MCTTWPLPPASLRMARSRGTSSTSIGTRRALPDFVDFVRNIGQPPDKALGGGSYGFGKAALYLASGARTVLIDTLCEDSDGSRERRFVGCALGDQYYDGDQPFTGRHWWGRISDGVPEPLIGNDAAAAAAALGLPERTGRKGLGTTVVIVAPQVGISDADGTDATMQFVGEALAWNFWPRMVATPGGVHRTMRFELSDEGQPLRLPNPRTHPRLRGFVEAMDRLRDDPEGEDPADPFVIDRTIECLRPIRRLGRLVIQTGPTAPIPDIARAVPQGARLTAAAVHHVALMRNAELVVRYLAGAEPITGRFGYSGAFRCAIDVDPTFAQAEPPTHDDWVPTFLEGQDTRATNRAQGCRQGWDVRVAARSLDDSAGVRDGNHFAKLAMRIKRDKMRARHVGAPAGGRLGR